MTRQPPEMTAGPHDVIIHGVTVAEVRLGRELGKGPTLGCLSA
jgi:hypothetical protein